MISRDTQIKRWTTRTRGIYIARLQRKQTFVAVLACSDPFHATPISVKVVDVFSSHPRVYLAGRVLLYSLIEQPVNMYGHSRVTKSGSRLISER